MHAVKQGFTRQANVERAVLINYRLLSAQPSVSTRASGRSLNVASLDADDTDRSIRNRRSINLICFSVIDLPSDLVYR